MHESVVSALNDAIAQYGAAYQSQVGQIVEPHLVYKKTGSQSWSGQYEMRPNFSRIARDEPRLTEVAKTFTDRLRKFHPMFDGPVGLSGLVMMNLLHDPAYVIYCILAEMWERYGTLMPSEAETRTLVDEFSEFIDEPIVRLRYSATLLNFSMDSDTISLPHGIVVRQYSEDEISLIHGGSLWHRGMATGSQRWGRIDEFVAEGVCTVEIVFGELLATNSMLESIRSKLDDVILALRTFKDGPVGYDVVRFHSIKFCPLTIGSYGLGGLYIPFGQYVVLPSEVEALQTHAASVSACTEPVMRIACSRLADAQIRGRPQDQLIDSVIGLEAILLAGMGVEDRRGELRFRFSLNYASLADTPSAREKAFGVARDLYDIRSAIAHGGEPGEAGLCKIGGEKLSLPEAAKRATEALRYVILRFLPEVNKACYKHDSFWKRRYFGAQA